METEPTDAHAQLLYRNQPAIAANKNPVFTIFIPTYNRANTLPRALASIERQSVHDFDVLVVDDGSTDDTVTLVRKWADKQPFAVTYVQQPNLGKHRAHNTALAHIRGQFTVLLDSDDTIHELGLQRLFDAWHSIPEERRPEFAGVEGLCTYMGSGENFGDSFPEDTIDSDHITLYQNLGNRGEKRNAIITEILRKYPYPVFEDEAHIRDSIIWRRMAHHYKFRFFNKVIESINQQSDGLTHNIFTIRMRSPRGFRTYFLEEITINSAGKPFRVRLKDYAKYARYSFHCGMGMAQQMRDIPSCWIYCLALPSAYRGYLRDRVRMRLRGLRR